MPETTSSKLQKKELLEHVLSPEQRAPSSESSASGSMSSASSTCHNFLAVAFAAAAARAGSEDVLVVGQLSLGAPREVCWRGAGSAVSSVEAPSAAMAVAGGVLWRW